MSGRVTQAEGQGQGSGSGSAAVRNGENMPQVGYARHAWEAVGTGASDLGRRPPGKSSSSGGMRLSGVHALHARAHFSRMNSALACHVTRKQWRLSGMDGPLKEAVVMTTGDALGTNWSRRVRWP